MPGNWNHGELTDTMAEGVRSAGGIPIEVHMIAVNRGITTDPERMKTSVVSREIIADSTCLGAGASDGPFTANAMAAAYELLCIPAADPLKAEAALARGGFGIGLVDRCIAPRSLAMRRSFENAIAGVMATGGSVNAVLAPLAPADVFGLPLSIDGYDRLSRSRPCAITHGAARHGLWPRSLRHRTAVHRSARYRISATSSQAPWRARSSVSRPTVGSSAATLVSGAAGRALRNPISALSATGHKVELNALLCAAFARKETSHV